ncbi:MAG: parB 1 [Acidobacteria bacterium]|nr:parB 1 [Acidobacteriota bacterium]
MDEFDLPESDSPALPPPHLSDGDLAAHADAQPARAREGLPTQYRMRAERHYVDQLMSPSTAAPIRMVRVAAFPAAEHVRVRHGDTLSQSIRVHGVVQPLLVRKAGAIYHVIAGKRRLAAAIAAGLEQIPCIVHDVDEEGAAGLRTAESVRGDGTPDRRRFVGAKLANSIQEIIADLSRVQTTLALLRAPSKPFQKAVALDLIAVQTWRTLWSAKLATLLAGGKADEVRRAPVAAVVDEVLHGFEPECRLSRLRLNAFYQGAAAVVVDQGLVGFALIGAIIVTLSLLDESAERTIEIHCDQHGDDGVRLEVVQRHSAISADTVAQFSSLAFAAAGSDTVALGAVGLAHATAAYGGAAELMALPDSGSSLRLTFTRM